MRARAIVAAAVVFMASPAAAQPLRFSFLTAVEQGAPNSSRIATPHFSFAIGGLDAAAPRPVSLRTFAIQQPENPPQQPLHAAAIEHSDAYRTRAKIHKIASFATLPLFATQLWLGQSLYDAPDGGKKSAHAAVGAGIAGLFTVNTITGAWNLFGEDRGHKEGRALRLTHAILMMAADAGFAATSLITPDSEDGLRFKGDADTHRALAFASIGLGTVGYLVMLFGNR